MNYSPILFSGAMVRAILEGRKTQTRRVVKKQPDSSVTDVIRSGCGFVAAYPNRAATQPFVWRGHSPYGLPGDRLWVRENGWQRPERTDAMMRAGADTWAAYYYDADLSPAEVEDLRALGFKHRPSIHMPRAACRIELEITDVQVARLREISEADAIAEGVTAADAFYWGADEWQNRTPNVARFASRWELLNGKRGFGWAANPWVFIVEFQRVELGAAS